MSLRHLSSPKVGKGEFLVVFVFLALALVTWRGENTRSGSVERADLPEAVQRQDPCRTYDLGKRAGQVIDVGACRRQLVALLDAATPAQRRRRTLT